MEKLTGEQILEILKVKEISWSDLGYNDVDWEKLELGKVKIVDDYGGEGEYHYIVQYETYFIKITCYSDSYGSSDGNKKLIQFVTPTVKTVTDYSAI